MADKKNLVFSNLYDLNKQAVLAQGRLSKSKIAEIKPQLEDWFNMQLDAYAMLLCRERYDFTVFHLYEKENKNPPAVAADELIEALKNRGKILSIEKDNINDNMWEIWIDINDEAFAYYLFNCDDFIIEC